MKKIKTKLIIGLSVLIIGFLINTSSQNMINTKALLEEEQYPYNVGSLDYTTWKWNTTEIVSTESTDTSQFPSLAVDSAGNIHVAWEDNTNYASSGTNWDIFYKRWNASTSSWTTTEIVSTESTFHSMFPALAVDAEGNVHIVWYDLTDYAGSGTDADIFYRCWNASTSLWTTTEVVSTESTADSNPPSLAVDSAGNIHVAWYDLTDYAGAGPDRDIFYKRWDAVTSLWTVTEVVSTESIGNSFYPSLAVDTLENVHIAWLDATDYASSGTDFDIFYKQWNAVTSLWTTTEVVSTESTADSLYPSLAIDTLENVHVAWNDQTDYASSGTDHDIFYKRWDAVTSLWTVTEVVSTESTIDCENPSLAIDAMGNIHIAWRDLTDYASSGTDRDIFYKRWDAVTSTWTTTEVVSTESTSTSENPSLATDALGNVHIAWEDYSVYAGSGTDVDIFYKQFAGSPAAPELAFIVPNPTDIDTVFLDWNNITGSTSYFVYRFDYYIWSVEELVPIDEVFDSFYIDILPNEGYFYYVIVARNFVGNSSHSNCQYVEYKIPHVREFSIISSLILAMVVFTFVIMRTRKKKSNPN